MPGLGSVSIFTQAVTVVDGVVGINRRRGLFSIGTSNFYDSMREIAERRKGNRSTRCSLRCMRSIEPDAIDLVRPARASEVNHACSLARVLLPFSPSTYYVGCTRW